MRIINLNKSYKDGKGSKQILKNINISFNKSGIVFITGRSGSGKTTLLNIIAGFDKADSGEIIDNDINVLNLSDNQLSNYRKFNVGFIAQDYHLVNDFTVLDNILLGDNTINPESDEFKSVINQLGLQEHLKKKSINLSGGEKQRVAIARVLLKGSSIILADEPTGNLDDENSEIVFKYLKEISKDHLVIVVTHDTNSAKKYADRIIELKSGEISSDSKKVEKDENLDFKFEGKEKFTTKKLFKYSLSFLFLKKIFLFICVLLCSVSFGEVFTMLSIQNARASDYAYNIIERESYDYFAINKRYVDYKGSYSANYDLPISEEETDAMINNFQLNDYEKSYEYYVSLSNKQTEFAFLNNYLSGIKVINNDDFLRKYNWELGLGYFPEKENEFLLTDFALYTMWQARPESVDEILGVEYSTLVDDEDLKNALKSITEVEKKELIFGENYIDSINDEKMIRKIRENPGLLFLGDWFVLSPFVNNAEKEQSQNWPKLVGSISTNYLEKYKDILFTLEKDYDPLNKNMAELKFMANYTLNSFYSKSNLNGYKAKGAVIDNNSNATKCIFSTSKFSEYNFSLNLNDDELIMSNSMFTRLFQKPFDNQEYTYTLDMVKNNNASITDNIIYSKDYKVKSVFTSNNTIKNAIGDVDIIIINDNSFNDYLRQTQNKSIFGLYINKKELSKINLKSDFFTKNKFTLFSLNAQSLYLSNAAIEVFSNTLMPIGLIALSIGYILIILFYVFLIYKRKRDIGIMKALGYSNKQFYLLLGGCGLIFFSILMVLSTIFSIIIFNIINVLCISNFSHYGLSIDTNLISMIPSYPSFFLIMGVTLLVLALTVVVANLINKKITPISAIKSL